jgi:hypothetical protein
MKCLPSGLNSCKRLLMYLTEMELNIVQQTLLYWNSSDLEYSLCTVLLTHTTAVRLAALKAKFFKGTGSSPWSYTYKSHTIHLTNLLTTRLPTMYWTVQLSADSVLCCWFVITSRSAEWNRKLSANCQSTVRSVDIAVARQNTAAAAMWIIWSQVSHVVQFGSEITQITQIFEN